MNQLNGINRDVAPMALGVYWHFFAIEMSALRAFYIEANNIDVVF
tara:strand:- start:1394 stop:1528 length:135 start_codon:yes stop_codon:yes gene_type:complete